MKKFNKLYESILNEGKNEKNFKNFYIITDKKGKVIFGQKQSGGNNGFTRNFESETEFEEYFKQEYKFNSGINLKDFK